MNALKKIELLEMIGVTLQSKMTFSEINQYFRAHGIYSYDVLPSVNSKRVYTKDVLAGEDDDAILEIAKELDIPFRHTSEAEKETTAEKEATFWKAGYFKLFLSHIASFKKTTSILQSLLKKYGISAFVAHEDIEPTKEWQDEIEVGLQTMDAFAAILMDGFKESHWCDQEVGVAIGRGILIIPIMRGLKPYGFIGKYQGIQAQNKQVGEVANAIFTTIVRSKKTRIKMVRVLSNLISQSTDINEAIEKIKILDTISDLPTDILATLRQQITENHILIESQKLLNSINKLLAKYDLPKVIVGSISTEKDWDEDIPF